MNWIPLTSASQLTAINQQSSVKPQLIFKHSSRCSISSMVLKRLERTAEPGNIDFYLLDLIDFRQLSNQVASDYAVAHESPQVLLIKNGECIYEESHSGIDMEEIVEQSLAG